MTANNANTSYSRLIVLYSLSAVVVIVMVMVVVTVAFARELQSGLQAGLQQGVQGITFPVPELGNCGSKEACRAYCNDPANIPTCVDFAKAHGLMNDDEAGRARKFARSVANGNGPGGCSSPDACTTYCGDTMHLEECVAFADEHGVKLQHDDPGRKLLAYLKSGGTMPGGCASRESCKTYCESVGHAEECIAFAEKAGLTFGDGKDGKKPEDARRFAEYMKRGETPGACQSKDACEAYCHDPSHFEECSAFAERIGLTKPGDSQKFRELHGKGPGGCVSRAACEAYCRADAHRDECYQFAEEHGVLKTEDVQNAKEGLVRVRAGLENVPPEVAACITTTLGADTVDRIMRGEFTPGQDMTARLKTCFERFGHDEKPRELFRGAPTDVIACLKEKLGDSFEKIRNGTEAPTPEMADTLRVCFAKMHMMRESAGPFMNAEGSEGMPGMAPQDFLRNAPPGIRECVAQKLGSTDVSYTGEMTAETKENLRDCFESFRPEEPGRSQRIMPPGESGTNVPDVVPGTGMGRELAECLARVKNELRSQAEGTSDTAALGQLLAASNKECYAKFGPGGGQTSGGDGGFVPPRPIGPPAILPSPGSSLPSEVSVCLRSRISEEELQNILRGAEAPASVREAIKMCMTTFMESRAGSVPAPGIAPCPMMPTVDSCPAGQKKIPAFSSPECGTYYTCAPEGTPAAGQPYPQPGMNTMPPPSSLGPLQNATANMSRNPFEIFVRFLLGL